MNKKKTYILIIAMLLVLAVSAVAGGLLLWSNRTATEQTEGENKLPTVNKKDEDDSKKEQTYKILVKNAEGSPIQGILAAFYDKAGNVVGEPGTTNNMGAITLKTEETNIASAKVLAVPYEYELNKEFHEFKASKKSVSIVLNENPNAYVAQIGDEVLLFKDAIAKANASETDVTIKLLADVHYAQSFHLNNAKGKTITLDGQGHTLNLYTTSHSIKIYQSTGIVNIQNMKIEHGGLGNLILVGTNDEQTELSTRVVNVNLSNLNIESESTHAYTLINTKRMQTINMNLSNVNLVWKTANEVKGGAIMPGVSGMDQVLNLTLKDSVIDVRQANGARGINAANKVTGEINLINTKILTSNGVKPVSKGKMTFTRDAASYLNDGTPDEAKIGDTIYNKLTEAMEAANQSETDVTITLLNDAKIEQHLLFENANGKNIILDGAGHTLTVATTGHSMYVHQKTGTVDIKNMKIVHSGEGNVLRIGKKKNTELSEDLVTVNLTNLDIYSSSTHAYTLIHTNESQKIDLNLSKVNLVWDTEKEGIKGGAIMASVSGLKQELNLTMRDCTVDVTKANGAKGIQAENAANGNINLYNTVIKTMKTEAVENDKMVLVVDTATDFHNGTADEVAIGTVTYNTLERAMLDANTSVTDVNITMLRDVEIYEPIVVNNVNGKNIVLDGAGHEMTAVFNAHTIYVNQKTGTFDLSNMDIVHGGTGCVIRIGDRNETYVEKIIVNLDDLGISSESSCAYGLIQAGYGTMELDLNMTDVDLTWDTTAEVQKGAIFAGLSGETTELNLTMTDCNIDSSNTTGAYGISAESGVTGTLVLNDTTIASNKDSVVDKKMKFTRNTATELSTYPATQVQIGDVVYNELSEAIEEANNSQEDVRLSFLSDKVTFASDLQINNVNGKTITLDGCNKTLVAKKAILIYQRKGMIEVKDLTVSHSGGSTLFMIGENSAKDYLATEKLTVDLKNLTINSTGTQTNRIIHAGNATMALDLNMTKVNFTLERGTALGKGVIMAGSSGKTTALNLTLKECTFDTTKASGSKVFHAEGGVTGLINIIDTDITTAADVNTPVYYNTMALSIDKDSSFYQGETQSVAIVDGVQYSQLANAVAAMNGKSSDTTMNLVKDITHKSQIKINVAKKQSGKITINGNGHTLTGDFKDATDAHFIYFEKHFGTVNLNNLTIEHKNTDKNLMTFGSSSTTDNTKTLVVNLKDVIMNSKSTNAYSIINAVQLTNFDITLDNVALNWETTADANASRAAIRYGNSGAERTVKLDIKDSTLDMSGAKNSGIVYAPSGFNTNSTISVENSVITPYDSQAIFKGKADDFAPAIYMDSNVYATLADAVAVANESEKNITIMMLKDAVITEQITVNNIHDKKVTLDGLGYTLTTSGNVSRILVRTGAFITKNLNVSHSAVVEQAGAPFMLGNDVAENKIQFTMKDCTVNVAGATEKVIDIVAGTAGTIKFHTTTVTTEGADVIADSGMTLSINKDTTFYQGTTQSVALVDGVQYSLLTAAITAMNGKSSDTTMNLVKDVTHASQIKINVANNQSGTITINGNGHTLTGDFENVTDAHFINFEKHFGTVNFNNLKIVHKNTAKHLINFGSASTSDNTKTVKVNFTDVTMNSESTNVYAIINTPQVTNFDITLEEVTLKWKTDSEAIQSTNANEQRAAIRYGNGGNRKVDLVIKDSTLDMSAAKDSGIVFAKPAIKDESTISVENSVITPYAGQDAYNEEAAKFLNE